MKFSNDDSTVNLLQIIKSNIFETLHVAVIAIVTAINNNIYICKNIRTGTTYDTLCAANVEASVGSIAVILFTDDNYLSDIAVYKASGNYGNSSANEQYHNIINGIIIETVSIYNNNLSVDSASTVIYNYITYTLSNDGTYYSVTACDTDATGDIVIYDSVGNIPVTNIADGSSKAGAFYNCTGITSITFGSEITSIGAYAFQSCTGLTELTISDLIITIGDYAFNGCTSLTTVIFGTGLTYIGSNAFRGDSGMTSVTFANTENWYRTKNSDYTGGTVINVTDSSANAVYFYQTYNEHYWYREE